MFKVSNPMTLRTGLLHVGLGRVQREKGKGTSYWSPMQRGSQGATALWNLGRTATGKRSLTGEVVPH